MTKPHYSGTGGKAIVARISQVAQPARARLYSLLHALGTLETHLLTELDAEPLEVREPWPSEALIEGLRQYVDWHGAAHTEECPADDTCECICQPLNDAVNSILREAFDRAVTPEKAWRQVGPDIPSGTGPLVDREGKLL